MRVRARRLAAIVLPLVGMYIIIASLGDQPPALSDIPGAVDPQTIQRNHPSNAFDPREVVTVHKRSNTGFNFWSNTNTGDEGLDLWPQQHAPHDDRIIKQIQYVPSSHSTNQRQFKQKMKVIFMPAGTASSPRGRTQFLNDECPVSQCILEDDPIYRVSADVVLWQNEYVSFSERPPHQIWILWLLESPFNTGSFASLKNYVNWTASYRPDSTIVTPYERFVHHSNFTILPSKPSRNYAKDKTKHIAWFVSNCDSNNKRFEYAHALAQYMPVDIYGACGPFRCARYNREECDKLLSREYRFYLAFENSNCVHYITEKFYWNALFNDVIPIVMGARKEDYVAVAPPHSFIHVDDFTDAKDLADYLIKLTNNDDLYNSYFRWKGTGYFLNTKYWCRLCSLVHGADVMSTARWYPDVDAWWRNNRTCVHDRWDAGGDGGEGYVHDWANYVF